MPLVFEDALKQLKTTSRRSRNVSDDQEWKEFRKGSEQAAAWGYLIRFSAHHFAWGTTSGKGTRIRNMCLFNPVTVGKYDRIIDYHMLKVAHGGAKEYWVGEFPDNTKAKAWEQQLRDLNDGQAACFGGLLGTRDEIVIQIFKLLKATDVWSTFESEIQIDFSDYIQKHHNQKRTDRGRSWRYGDVLEPGGLERFGLSHFRKAIETVLDLTVRERNVPAEGSGITKTDADTNAETLRQRDEDVNFDLLPQALKDLIISSQNDNTPRTTGGTHHDVTPATNPRTRFYVDESMYQELLHRPSARMRIDVRVNDGKHPAGDYNVPHQAAVDFIESKRNSYNWEKHRNWHSASIPVPMRPYFTPSPR